MTPSIATLRLFAGLVLVRAMIVWSDQIGPRVDGARGAGPEIVWTLAIMAAGAGYLRLLGHRANTAVTLPMLLTLMFEPIMADAALAGAGTAAFVALVALVALATSRLARATSAMRWASTVALWVAPALLIGASQSLLDPGSVAPARGASGPWLLMGLTASGITAILVGALGEGSGAERRARLIRRLQDRHLAAGLGVVLAWALSAGATKPCATLSLLPGLWLLVRQANAPLTRATGLVWLVLGSTGVSYVLPKLTGQSAMADTALGLAWAPLWLGLLTQIAALHRSDLEQSPVGEWSERTGA